MDQLKQVLKYHFWILGGCSLLLPLLGWYFAASGYARAIESQQASIKGAFDSVEGLTGKQVPNPVWAEAISPYVDTQAKRNEESWRRVWDLQKQLMVWPSGMQPHVPDKFRGEFPLSARMTYRSDYNLEVERVWTTADPFDVETAKGTVIFPRKLMPYFIWAKTAPTNEEIWDKQQDLWLLESLLKSVRSMNATASIPGDAIVRRIDMLELRGGSGSTAPLEGEAGMEDMEMMDEYGEMGMMMGADMTGVSADGSVGLPMADFDPSDEFGDDAKAIVEGEAEASFDDFGMMDPSMMMGLQGENLLRYVGPQTPEEEGGKYFLKRGFYVRVVMDMRRIPEFLVAIQKSEWPVAISRVQWVVSSPMGTPGSMPGMAGGMMMGDPSGMMGDSSGGGAFGGGSFGASPDIGMSMGGMGGMGGMDMNGLSASMITMPFAQQNKPDPTDPFNTRKKMLMAKAQAALANSMNSPYLATVAISGLITLYNPVPEDALTEAEATQLEQQDANPVAVPVDMQDDLPDLGNAPDTENPGTQNPGSENQNGAMPADGATTTEGAAMAPDATPPADDTPPAAVPMTDPGASEPVSP